HQVWGQGPGVADRCQLRPHDTNASPARAQAGTAAISQGKFALDIRIHEAVLPPDSVRSGAVPVDFDIVTIPIHRLGGFAVEVVGGSGQVRKRHAILHFLGDQALPVQWDPVAGKGLPAGAVRVAGGRAVDRARVCAEIARPLIGGGNRVSSEEAGPLACALPSPEEEQLVLLFSLESR